MLACWPLALYRSCSLWAQRTCLLKHNSSYDFILGDAWRSFSSGKILDSCHGTPLHVLKCMWLSRALINGLCGMYISFALTPTSSLYLYKCNAIATHIYLLFLALIFFCRKKLISNIFCIYHRIVQELPMHLWYFFLGKFEFGLRGAQCCGLAHLPVRLCFQQQQNNKGNLCFESVLITVGSHFSVLQSQVFCRILGRDFDDGYLLVGRFFCVPTLEMTAHCFKL